ncbi:MAG: HEPN domain-containing protein [Dehalococcoidia bacterium]|nr:HEPN domain-containing protein [Dehalococcoidia bacterium]
MKVETKEWVDMAQTDLEAAKVLLENDLRPPTVFHSHLAVEKMLKAHWIEQNEEGYPPRTHDLMELLGLMNFDLPQWRSFLTKLSPEAVASRYAKPDTYSQQTVVEYIQGSKELCAQLLQMLN